MSGGINLQVENGGSWSFSRFGADLCFCFCAPRYNLALIESKLLFQGYFEPM